MKSLSVGRCITIVTLAAAGSVKAQGSQAPSEPPPSQWALLARGALPGFAGIAGLTYPNQPGEPPRCVVRIAMTDTVRFRKKIEEYFAKGDLGDPYPTGVCIGARTFQAIQVRYDFAQLEDWMHAIMRKPATIPSPASAIAQLGSFTRARIVSSANRIEIFTVDSALRRQFVERVEQLHVPKDAFKLLPWDDVDYAPVSGAMRVTSMVKELSSESMIDAMRTSDLEGFAAFSTADQCSALVSAKDTSDSFKRKAEAIFLPQLSAMQQRVPGLCPTTMTLTYRKVKFDAGELYAWYRFSLIKIPTSDSVPSRMIDRAKNALVFVLADLKDSLRIRRTMQDGSVPGDAIRFESLAQRLADSRTFFEFQVDKPAQVTGAFDRLYDQLIKPYPGPPAVAIQFVVTPAGDVDRSTIRVSSSVDEELTKRLLKEIPTLHFTPAIKYGLPVRQLVMGRFSNRAFF